MKRDIRSKVRLRFAAWSHSVVAAVAFAITSTAFSASIPSAPEFTIPGGVFTNAVTFSLRSADAGATVRFTLDGSEPGLNSPAFTKPTTLTNSAMVRARAFVPGRPAGELVANTFLLLDADVADFSSDLPIVVVATFGEEIQKDERIVASLRTIQPGKGRSTLNASADFDGRTLINLRGRASLRYAKRSYTLKTVDARNDMAKFQVLGLPKESDWVLYAPYPDKTLMRDVIAYELSNQIGRWAPRTRFVELFLNETGGRISRQDYMGVYVFEEKVARGKNRVNIAGLGPDENSEPALTGGYIFKKDHGDGEAGPMQIGGPAFQSSSSSKTGFPTGPGAFPADPAGFQPPYRGRSSSSSSSSSRSSRSSRDTIVTNRLGSLTARQLNVAGTRTVIRSDDDEEIIESDDNEKYFDYFRSTQTNKFFFVDPEPDELTAVQRAWLKDYINGAEAALYGPDFRDPENGYAAFIDSDAFIDYHLLVEVTKNVDGFRFSTFYHKDRGGKIRMGPLWDWNLSFGNCNGKQGYMAENWMWPQLDDKEYSWFRRLFEDPDFGQRYVDRWTQLRATTFSSSNMLGLIDRFAGELAEAQVRNFERWPILGVTVSPNWFVGDTYADEVKWMRDWTSNRLEWIERQFPAVPSAEWRDGVMSLATSKGKIFYTVDASDPRSSGGNVSSKAAEYAMPVTLKAGQELRARTQVDGRWSGLLVRRGP